MSDEFDPYYRWLGIPRHEQPPNHYRLLGIELFESDPQLIDSFALRHTSFLRAIIDGPHLRDAQRLLNELAAARRCLLNAEQKAAYDAALRQRLAEAGQRARSPHSSDTPSVQPADDGTYENRPPAAADAPIVVAVASGDKPPAAASAASSRRSASDARDRPRIDALPQTRPGTRRRAAKPVAATMRPGRGACGLWSARGWVVRGASWHPAWVVAGALAVLLAGFGIGAAVLMRTPPTPPTANAMARRAPATAVESVEATIALSAQAQPAREGQPSGSHEIHEMHEKTAPVRAGQPSGGEPRPLQPADLGPADPLPDTIAAGGTALEIAAARFAKSERARSVDGVAGGGVVSEGRGPRLDGLLLWLDASSVSTVDGRVVRWSDAGGGRYTAEARQASHAPEVLADALAGKPVVRFRGAQWLEVPGTSQAFNLGEEYTIVHVARGVAGTLIAKGEGNKAGQFILDFASCLRLGGAADAADGGRLCATADDPTMFRIRALVADATGVSWFLDGASAGVYLDEPHTIQNRSMVRIGCPSFRGEPAATVPFFVGDVAELLIYGRALSAAERTGVEGYLHDKWFAGDAPPAPLDMEPPRAAADSSPDGAGAAQPTVDADHEAAESSTREPSKVPASSPDSPPGAPSADAELFRLFVNLGGDTWEDPAGVTWVRSKKFDSATFGHEGGQAVRAVAAEHPMYGTAVRGLVAFRVVVPNGDYAVTLHFQEHWTKNAADRTFWATIEQNPLSRPPRPFQGPGFGRPYVHEIPKVSVRDGRLDVDFYPASPGSSAILNGIAIRQLR